MSDIKLGVVFDVKKGRFLDEAKENTLNIKQSETSTAQTAEHICIIDCPKSQVKPPKYSDDEGTIN